MSGPSDGAPSKPAAATEHSVDDQNMGNKDQRLADVLAELTDQVCRGQIVDFDQACRDNSDIADDLRHLWGAILITDTAGAVHDENPVDSGDRERGNTPTAGGTDSSGDGGGRWRSLQLPTTIGDYQLIEEVGRGGMGVVFRARQISLEREVAVKMILRGRLASDADLQRFLAEASATAQLKHPCIVPVYEVGDMDGRPFFSMQFIEGQTLADRVAGGPLPQREAARVVAEVAKAIEFAHAHGVLHRDLKP
ncbi:MAG: serine/threonine-protein kinase, partial [Planctomycetota bacterium]